MNEYSLNDILTYERGLLEYNIEKRDFLNTGIVHMTSS